VKAQTVVFKKGLFALADAAVYTTDLSGKKRFSNWSLWSALKREQVVLTGPQSRLQTSIEPCGSRSSTTLGGEKSQTNPSLEQVRKVTDGNISSEGRKTLIQLPQ